MTESNLQVRSRLSKSLTWKDAHFGESLIADQYVFTGENAFAKIQLTSGTTISVNEKSLIRVSANSNDPLLVEKGLVKIKITDDKPLELSLDGKLVSIAGKDAELVMNIQEGNQEIGITKGEAELKLGDKVQAVTTKDHISFSDNQIKLTEKISLLTPVDGARSYINKKNSEVIFTWEGTQSVKLEVSSDIKFNNILHSVNSRSPFKLNLSAGKYYWRVTTESSKSLTSHFSLIQETAPKIISPKNGETLRIVDYGKDESIALEWDSENELVDLELKKNSELIVFENITSPFLLPVKESMKLEWRVKKSVDTRLDTIWSLWQKNEVLYLKTPAAPSKLSPEIHEQITYGEAPQFVNLSWEGSSSSYLIEVRSKDGLESIYSQTSRFDYILKSPGEYEWRVRAENEYSQVSEFSVWNKFSWRDESASLNDKAQKIVLKRPSQKVSFNWEDPNGQEVQFQLAKDASFSDVVIQKNLKTDATEVTFPEQGEFFWRTQKINSNGEKILSAPKKVIIEPAPAPERPEALPEVEVPLEYIESTYIKSWIDFIISRAFADDLNFVANLSWPKKEDAEFYLIEIFSDENGENKIHELKTKETHYGWKNPKMGEYYWRWAVVDYWGRVSPYSELSVLKVVPPQNFKLEKSKLYRPIRKAEINVGEEIQFLWSPVKETENYIFELSGDDDFDEVIKKETLKTTSYKLPSLHEGDYFWRVFTHKWDQSRKSSTGRFSVVKPILETKSVVEKKFSAHDSVLILSWAPSLDSFQFETADAEGDISGNVLVGVKLEYQKKITDTWRGEASLLHQSGKVFDEENYKYRHLKLGASRKVGERLTLTPSIGLIQYQEYSQENKKIIGKDQNGFDLGGELRYEFLYPESKWEAYLDLRAGSVLSYGIGVRRYSEKWTQGLIFQNRMFDNSEFEGAQTSVRLEIGRLFSFD